MSSVHSQTICMLNSQTKKRPSPAYQANPNLGRLLPALFLLSALSACGFQLRDAGGLGFGQIYVDDRIDIQQLIDHPISTQLRTDLQPLTTEIFSNLQADIPGIVIINEQLLERSLSLSSNLLNRQIEIEKRVDYQIINAKGEILTSNSLIANREMVEDQSNPAAKDQERKLLIDAINTDLSRQLIRQLSSLLTNESQS